MTTPEGKIKLDVGKILANYGEDLYSYMPVPGGYGKPTLDYMCCYRGCFFAIETKAPGKKPTKYQLLTIEDMQKAGGVVFVVNDGPSLERLRSWLEYLRLSGRPLQVIT